MPNSSIKIRNIDDIKKIEKIPHTKRFTEKSTYELLEKSAALSPSATAIHFIENGEKYDKPIKISYDEFIGKVRQTANLFNDLGAGPEDVITYILPNDDIASIYHTGGTTGLPKLAKRTHYNEIFISRCSVLAVNMSKSRGCVLSGLPLYHCNATIITGLTPFSAGKTVTILSSSGFRNPSIIQAFYKIVETYEAFMFSSVPTVLGALLQVPVDGDISSLEYTCCGAAPLSVALFKRFEKITNIKILNAPYTDRKNFKTRIEV